MSAVTILRIRTLAASRRLLSRAIEPLAHLLAGLEERHRFLFNRHVGAGARISPSASRSMLDRKGAEAAQLHAVAARHRGDDLVKYGVDDVLHIALVEMRVLQRDALNELGFDHCRSRPLRRTSRRLIRQWRVPKRQ